MRVRISFPWAMTLTVLWLIGARGAQCQDGLKVIDDPGGGQVVYGPIDASTPQSAMAGALHYVHLHFGDSPVVGKVFQSRDRQNFGAFFTVTEKVPDNRKVAGLVIVSLANGAKPAAAVLYDLSSRFASTEPGLLSALTAAWRNAAGGIPAPAPIPTRFPDGSGAVDLPAGWRIAFASHGAAKIVGPQGELVLLSNSIGPIYDSGNPQVQARLRFANASNPPILCPRSDALNTYLCVLQRSRPQPSFQLKTSRPLTAQGRIAQAVLIDAELDLQDGKGPLSCELGLRVTAISALGDRTLGINGTCAPRGSLPAEQPILKAVYDSYSVNGQVVASQYAADERRSRQAGSNARAQANAAHATEDAQSAAFQAHMDNIDRFSKSFQSYQLDQSELQDNNLNARGAVPNALADALIKADPDRFEAVPTQNFLKGIDF
jgi:hypothetical protein